MDLSPNIAPKFVVIGLNTDKEMSTLFEVTKKHSLSFLEKLLFSMYTDPIRFDSHFHIS